MIKYLAFGWNDYDGAGPSQEYLDCANSATDIIASTNKIIKTKYFENIEILSVENSGIYSVARKRKQEDWVFAERKLEKFRNE